MHYKITSLQKNFLPKKAAKINNQVFFYLMQKKSVGFISGFFALIFLSFSSSLFAWNAVGHMVVASIAYQNVKPEVRQKIDKLVGFFQKEYPQMTSFLQIAVWPDAIRGQRIEAFNHWHYTNLPFTDDNSPLHNPTEPDNAVWAMRVVKTVTKNNAANSYERARFLAFFIHIIGDLHQPLHTITRISAQLPRGDEGGNLYYIRYQKSNRIKLHAFWDDGLESLAGDDNSLLKAQELSQAISQHYPMSYFGDKVTDLNPNNWANEGLYLARKYIYSTPEDKVVSTQYITQGREVVEQRLALAGYRAAKLLNMML